MSVPRLIHDVEFPDLGADDVLQGKPVLASGCVGVELGEFIPVFLCGEDGVLEGLEFIIEGFEFWGWGDPVGSVILDLHGLPVDGFAHEFTSLSCVDGDCIMFLSVRKSYWVWKGCLYMASLRFIQIGCCNERKQL